MLVTFKKAYSLYLLFAKCDILSLFQFYFLKGKRERERKTEK